MVYDFGAFEAGARDAVEWLKKEFSGIRTGRATPALLDSVQVDAYGTRSPIQHVANVAVEDARTLRITPYDAGQVKEIEKAITDADLGISVGVDDKGLRVAFPELTSERREQLLKAAKHKLEDARISIRKARDEETKRIDAAESEGGMSEDDKFRYKEELQKLVDKANAALDEFYERKETEIKQ